MKTIEEKAIEHTIKIVRELPIAELRSQMTLSEWQSWFVDEYTAGFKDAQQWISVEDELPLCPNEDDGFFYSDYLYVKVNGYSHPFVAFYIKTATTSIFDFIFQSIQESINQSDITHWRPNEYK